MNNQEVYLDTTKSVMISAPAGSGKTERLARRYIALLKSGVAVERILAITFTEKAAAEMKQRILSILQKGDPSLFTVVLNKLPLMRVTTIHAFCGSLLRRFSFEAGIDSDYEIEDAISSRMAWEDILYEVLMNAGDDGNLLKALSERGFRGLDHLRNTLNYLFNKNPFSYEVTSFSYTGSQDKVVRDELLNWPVASSLINDYATILTSSDIMTWKTVEKCFLTSSKSPRKRPPAELKSIPDFRAWAEKMYLCWRHNHMVDSARRTERLLRIFLQCEQRFLSVKRLNRRLDFSDLEYLAFRMIHEHPEWANILYAFDERTDHILVDEFQDINYFQWQIISKLTEEWRSGIGAKRDSGVRPTIFLVGDDKQSIYYFRGANVELFHRAREELSSWLRHEFAFNEAKLNHRSRPAIISFTNNLFTNIMRSSGDDCYWRTQYRSFEAAVKDDESRGRVELIFLDDEASGINQARSREAAVLAKRILSLVSSHEISERDGRSFQRRKCRFGDIAILLRKRTHLDHYESALRRFNIPYVAVKGVGFYQEPEVAILRALVFFLSNPLDDYSLYVILSSPFFSLDDGTILSLVEGPGNSLFDRLKNAGSSSESARHQKDDSYCADMSIIYKRLSEWIMMSKYTALAELIEFVMTETGAWRHFHDEQSRANIKKFIRLMEDLESGGNSLIMIREFLERNVRSEDEPKANVNTEGMDAVKIMTIHSAKGLEFPVVILPGLDDSFSMSSGDNLIFERDGRFIFKSLAESVIRKKDPDFLLHEAKEIEEQKRLFYVAVTRAEDTLVMISRSGGDKSFFGFLQKGLSLDIDALSKGDYSGVKDLFILREDDVEDLFKQTGPPVKPLHRKVAIPDVINIPVKKQFPWLTVTGALDIAYRHGNNWLILGDVLHRVFESVSKNIVQDEHIKTLAEKLLISRGIRNDDLPDKSAIIEDQIKLLKETGIWQDVVLPRENSFAELPFILESDNAIYSGRIDRVILQNNICHIFDYKTFPVKTQEVDGLVREYSFQLATYKNAMEEIFGDMQVRTNIIFTHIGVIRGT